MSPRPLPIRRLAFLIIASLLLLFFWMVRGVVLPVFVAALFAILLYPLCTRLEKKLAEILGGLATGTPQLVLAAFLFVIGLYFFLRDGKAVTRRLAALLPFSAPDVDALFSSVHATVKGAILGSALTGAVQSALCILMLFILGVPGPFVWGTFAFVLSFIPMFGTAPVTAGATIYLFATGHPVSGIVMGAAGVLIGLSDNIVRPWVQGTLDHMHPLIALLAVFGGLAVFGFAGVFLGPVVAACALWALGVYGRSILAGSAPRSTLTLE